MVCHGNLSHTLAGSLVEPSAYKFFEIYVHLQGGSCPWGISLAVSERSDISTCEKKPVKPICQQAGQGNPINP